MPRGIGRGLLFFLDALACEQSGQKYKDNGLDQAVEQIEIDAEDGRHHGGYQVLDDLHDDECAQNVTEQSHTQCQGTNGNFHQVDGEQNGHRVGKTLHTAAQAVIPELRTVDQHQTHDCQGSGHADILGRGRQTKNADDVCEMLNKAKVPYNYIEGVGKYVLFNIFCATQEKSSAVKEILKAYEVKYFVSESKTL